MRGGFGLLVQQVSLRLPRLEKVDPGLMRVSRDTTLMARDTMSSAGFSGA